MEKETAAPSSTLAWRIPWTEEPGGLQSRGSQRVGHDRLAEHAHTCTSAWHVRALGTPEAGHAACLKEAVR